MATTENLHAGDGNLTNFSFTFPYIKLADVEVYKYTTDAWVKQTLTDNYTFSNATTVSFNSAPAAATSAEQTNLGNTSNIKIKRNTDSSKLVATFYPGSAIRSSDLNDNFTQNIYVTQEAENDADSVVSTAATANTNADSAVTTANSASTTATTANTNATAAKLATDTLVGTTSDGGSTWTTVGDGIGDNPQGLNYAITTATTAKATADSAASTVSDAVPYTIVANKAALFSASPSVSGAFYEVTDATNMDNTSGGTIDWVDASGSDAGDPLPASVTWNSGITIRVKWRANVSGTEEKWEYVSYRPQDTEARYAPIASPTLTGTPAAPTAAADTNTTQIATTAYVQTELGDYLTTTLGATKASPALTGTPTAPTAASGTNTTQVATTAFVKAVAPSKGFTYFCSSF